MNPIISVVIPFKNAAATLPRCIKSVKAQSVSDFNCVLIDDGSTDDGFNIALSLIDERFKLVKNPVNLGVSISRNIGNALTLGDIICVLDSDDEALPNRFDLTANAFESNDKLALFCGATLLTLPSAQLLSPTDYDPFGFSLHNPFVHSSVAYSKAFLLEHNIHYNPSLIVAHDYDLYRQIYFAGGIVGVSTEPASIRHDAPLGLMASNPTRMVSETVTVRRNILLELFPDLSARQIKDLAAFLTFNGFKDEAQIGSILKSYKLLLSDNGVPAGFKKIFHEKLSYFLD